MKSKSIKIPFFKMNGAGNDFVLIDNRKTRLKLQWAKVAHATCDRRFGIGADGLLVIERSMKNDFTMLYYNADGSSGGMCGNGGRCVSAYVMREDKSDKVSFDAVGYTYSAKRMKGDIWLTMKDPNIHFLKEVITVNKKKMLTSYIDSGSPHVIIFRNDLTSMYRNEIDSDSINGLGKAIRNHKRFSPKGTNANFISIIKDGYLSMRTYERGVEDETLACGTGAVASAISCSMLLGWKSPIKVKTRGGEILAVRFQRDGDSFSEVILCGPVQFSFKGEFTID